MNWYKYSQQNNSPKINLTPEEERVFSHILQARNNAGLSVPIRVAGGWVRDKLMGIPSDDIDIALEGMTGREFVRKAFGENSGAIIEANPDQSKHLETVKVNILGHEVDFVNLRSEDYADSRVPDMKMATPEIDAQRRDLTINALFYNLDTNQVEDYVGGIQDLKQGVLRTPLDPKKTFLDDPLRILRALRFNSRYGDFKLAPEILAELDEPDVQQAYAEKVKSERAGKEVIKMMSGEDPASSVRVLFETGLYKQVFDIPDIDEFQDISMDQMNRHHKLNLMNHILSVVDNLNTIMKEEGEDDEIRGLMNLAAVFHDFGKMAPGIQQPHHKREGEMSYIGHEGVSAEIAEHALKEIGIGANERKFISKVVDLHMRPHSYPEQIKDKSISKFIGKSKIPGQGEGSLEEKWEDLYKKIPVYTYYHAIADSMSKGSDDYHEDVAKKREHINRINEFMQQQQKRPDLSEVLGKKPGEWVMEKFPDINPKTGFISEVIKKLMHAYRMGNLKNENSAHAIVDNMNIRERYAEDV